MGIAFSCPLSDIDDLDSHFNSVLVKSISFGDGEERTAPGSVSFNGRNAESLIMRSCGSGKIVFEGSLSFKGRELETTFSFRTPTADMENKVVGRSISSKNGSKSEQMIGSGTLSDKMPQLPLSESENQRYQAAVKLQKVYKSFRTRRQLADCAVLVEQKWWKLLDFAELKQSSISFFDIERPETAISRWSRASKRAAKVGKGLSKDEKARKLALQHWLEAIDPRHRYGHNLQFYYAKWLHCESKQPFFYWLDIGDGKEVNLERCPRSKLQQQCIKYLGPTERQAYEVVVENGKFVYKQSGELINTLPKDAEWIFVLSASKKLYVGQKNKGTFQHSSFLAGGATLSAGRLIVENGVLKAVWPHSGHYLPTEENFEEFMSFLKEHNVNLSSVERSPAQEEEEGIIRKGSIQNIQSDTDIVEDTNIKIVECLTWENTISRQQDPDAAEHDNLHTPKLSYGLRSKITKLEIPKRSEVFDILQTEALRQTCHTEPANSSAEDGYETAEDTFLTEEDFMFPKPNLFNDDEEEEKEESIPRDKIMQRIDSHKGMKSYQLAKQLSSKWTTGAGPRIGFMKDYPSELRFQVLEKANLSPRSRSSNSSPRTTSHFSPKVSASTPLSRETTCRSPPSSDRAI